jgi:hypothetical protein
MGAEYNFEKLKATTKEAALVEGAKMIDQAAWERGHGGYTGSWAECTGVSFVTCPAGVNDIQEWLDETAEKWGPMVITEFNGAFYAGAICSC